MVVTQSGLGARRGRATGAAVPPRRAVACTRSGASDSDATRAGRLRRQADQAGDGGSRRVRAHVRAHRQGAVPPAVPVARVHPSGLVPDAGGVPAHPRGLHTSDRARSSSRSTSCSPSSAPPTSRARAPRSAAVTQLGPLVTVLVVAGAGSTAICADLGARTIREEIDALEVLGIDPIHRLVVPRVVASTFVAVLLNGAVITIGLVGGFIFGVYLQNVSAGAYVSTLTLITGLPEVVISIVKAAHLRPDRRSGRLLPRPDRRRRRQGRRHRGERDAGALRGRPVRGQRGADHHRRPVRDGAADMTTTTVLRVTLPAGIRPAERVVGAPGAIPGQRRARRVVRRHRRRLDRARAALLPQGDAAADRRDRHGHRRDGRHRRHRRDRRLRHPFRLAHWSRSRASRRWATSASRRSPASSPHWSTSASPRRWSRGRRWRPPSAQAPPQNSAPCGSARRSTRSR